MNMTRIKKSLSVFLCMVLIAAMALFATGCNDNSASSAPAASAVSVQESSQESNVLGEGSTQFTFTVTDGDGKDTAYEIHTDKTVVGEALQELGLIEGEDGEFGLYVKTVDGITADYDVDGTYWAFYVDGEYASSGVDTTDITPGATYSFKVEKG